MKYCYQITTLVYQGYKTRCIFRCYDAKSTFTASICLLDEGKKPVEHTVCKLYCSSSAKSVISVV